MTIVIGEVYAVASANELYVAFTINSDVTMVRVRRWAWIGQGQLIHKHRHLNVLNAAIGVGAFNVFAMVDYLWNFLHGLFHEIRSIPTPSLQNILCIIQLWRVVRMRRLAHQAIPHL